MKLFKAIVKFIKGEDDDYGMAMVLNARDCHVWWKARKNIP